MVTIQAVADAAGVSISTVSYALSGKRPIGADTRRRIEEAVAALGYSPNASARTLAGRRTHVFALTEPLRMDTHTPTHMAFVLATTVAARRQDYDVLLLTEEDASAGMSRVAAGGMVDAVLVLDVAPDDERVEIARRIPLPTVFIGVPTDHEGLICVDLDFEAAATLAVDRLADAGHAMVGLVGQAEVAYEKSNFPPRVREAARARADERHLRFAFRTSGDRASTAAASRRAAGELLDAGATALLVHASDDVHDAVAAELESRRLSIPDDVSVISVAASFDAGALAVPVDSIPLIPAASCDLAVDLALRAADGERIAPTLQLIPPVYQERGSVAPAPTD